MEPWGIALFSIAVGVIAVTVVRIIVIFVKDAKEKKNQK